jgi:type I restriction enzyme M protein
MAPYRAARPRTPEMTLRQLLAVAALQDPDIMFKIVGEAVFPFLRTLGRDGSTYSEHMKDARFTIPTAQLPCRVVDMLDDIPMADRDTNGDLCEYVLSKRVAGTA